MATLLSAVSANGAGTGAAQTGATDVYATGTFDGCTVTIQVGSADANYVKADNVSVNSPARFEAPGVCKIDGTGDYYIRAVVSNAGPSTSVTVVTT